MHRSKSLYRLPTNDSSTAIQLEIEHLPSGPNFLNGGTRKAGYYLKAYQVNTLTNNRVDAHYHIYYLLIKAPRFGPTTLNKLVEQLTITPIRRTANYLELQSKLNAFTIKVNEKWPITNSNTNSNSNSNTNTNSTHKENQNET